ncbi:MAG TPA: hypothetical protein VF743_11040 [Acidimicrobiales bacterium]
MDMRSRVSRRVVRGTLVALAAITLGASSTAGASDTDGTRHGATGQQAGDPQASPITSASEGGPSAAAATGDVTALAATGLSYSTVDPCRIFDTRFTGDGTVGAGRPVIGYSLVFQGSCGLPADGSVKAVMVNVIAVNTSGTGYVRSAAEPFDPNSGATILNFNNGLVSSNAIPLQMCDVATDPCDVDLGFIVNGGSAHIVFDLIGYFS